MEPYKIPPCCNCCQNFSITGFSYPLKGRVPYTLVCGHPICERCLYVSSSQSLKCNDCQVMSTLPQRDSRNGKDYFEIVKQHFPINPLILGQLTYNYLYGNNAKVGSQQAIPNYLPAGCSTMRLPYNQRPSNVNRQHRTYSFRCSQDLDKFISTLTYCKEHAGKNLEFYCNTCSKTICSNCLVKTCSGHKFILTQELDTDYEVKILEAKKAVKDIQLRIGNTIRILERKRIAVMCGSVDTKSIESQIVNHFAQIFGQLLVTQQDLLKSVHSSRDAYDTFMEELKVSMETLMNLVAAADYSLQNKESCNLPAILTALELAAETPWFLENDASPLSPNIELVVDPDIKESIKNFCKLKMDTSNLKLLATSQLPSYMEVPPPPEDTTDTASQKSGKSSQSSLVSGFDVDRINFEFRLKSANKKLDNMSISGQQVSTVKPLPTINTNEKPIKPLAVGMEEKVTVTHINNPHDFYVQRLVTQSKVHSLSEGYSQMKETLVAPQPDDIKEGDTFITYDNTLKWTRVNVLQSTVPDSDNKCLVRFMDFGHIAEISKQRIRMMPEPRIPSFAIHCCLAECEPINSTWNEEDNKLMTNIIARSGKSCVMSVVGKKDEIFLVDLVSTPLRREETPTSLRDALTFLGHATFTTGTNKIHRQGRCADFSNISSQYFYPARLSDVEEVDVTMIIDPYKFFVRKKYLLSYYQNMNQQLNNFYSLENETGVIFSPTQGMCVACYVDEEWYRGRIVSLKPNSHVCVYLVDVGMEHCIPWNHIRKLIPKFYKSEELVSQCKLANIKPIPGDTWSSEAITLMRNAVSDASVCILKLLKSAKRKKGSGNDLVVLYKRDEDSIDTCINTLIVNNGFAEAQGNLLAICKQEKPQTVTKVEKPPAVNPVPQNMPSTSAANTTPLQQTKIAVKVLSAVSPSELYIFLKSPEIEEELKNLHKELQKVYKTTKPDNSCKWVGEEKCVALSKKKHKWTRGLVNSVNDETKQATVFLCDFGITENLSFDNLRPLAPRFMNVANGSKKCHLSGIAPASGDKWPMLTCESLQEIIEEYDEFYITKGGVFEGNSLPIDLWYYHVTPGGALTPTIKEYRKVNDRIIENGLAIPTRILKKKEDVINTPQEEVKDQVEEQTSLSLEPVDKPAVTLEQWLPSVPLKHKEFVANATYVEDNLDIFLYDVEENLSTLELLSTCLTNKYKDSTPSKDDLYWFPNTCCIAKYDVDNKYYRAQVINVNDDNTVLVRFVDYGNTQACPITSLRKNVVMHHIPIQSYRCRLQGIKPVNGETWDQNTGDLVHQSIVDKQSLVTVVGDPDEGGIIPISLKINMTHDLSNLLISLNYAAPIEKKAPKPSENKKEQVDDGPDIIVEEEIPEANTNAQLTGVDWNKLNDEYDKP